MDSKVDGSFDFCSDMVLVEGGCRVRSSSIPMTVVVGTALTHLRCGSLYNAHVLCARRSPRHYIGSKSKLFRQFKPHPDIVKLRQDYAWPIVYVASLPLCLWIVVAAPSDLKVDGTHDQPHSHCNEMPCGGCGGGILDRAFRASEGKHLSPRGRPALQSIADLVPNRQWTSSGLVPERS